MFIRPEVFFYFLSFAIASIGGSSCEFLAHKGGKVAHGDKNVTGGAKGSKMKKELDG